MRPWDINSHKSRNTPSSYVNVDTTFGLHSPHKDAMRCSSRLVRLVLPTRRCNVNGREPCVYHQALDLQGDNIIQDFPTSLREAQICTIRPLLSSQLGATPTFISDECCVVPHVHVIIGRLEGGAPLRTNSQCQSSSRLPRAQAPGRAIPRALPRGTHGSIADRPLASLPKRPQ